MIKHKSNNVCINTQEEKYKKKMPHLHAIFHNGKIYGENNQKHKT